MLEVRALEVVRMEAEEPHGGFDGSQKARFSLVL